MSNETAHILFLVNSRKIARECKSLQIQGQTFADFFLSLCIWLKYKVITKVNKEMVHQAWNSRTE